jgi:chromosomal replication initiation ATPase DnaA
MGVVEFTEDHFRAPPDTRPDAQRLASEVAARFGLSAADVMGPARHPVLVRARTALYLALREEPYGWSYPQIGRFVGNRDHTTVLAAVRGAKDPAWRAAKRQRQKECWAMRGVAE